MLSAQKDRSSADPMSGTFVIVSHAKHHCLLSKTILLPLYTICSKSPHEHVIYDIDTIYMIMLLLPYWKPKTVCFMQCISTGTANKLGGNSGETSAFRLHSLFHGVCCSSLRTRGPGFNLELRLAAIGQHEGSEHATAHNIQGDPFIISHFPDPLLSTLIFDN